MPLDGSAIRTTGAGVYTAKGERLIVHGDKQEIGPA